MPATIENQETAAETYLDVERLVQKTVFDFHRSHGGDEIELASVCNELFIKAYTTWDPDRCRTFSGFLRHKLWFGMFDYRRQELRKASRFEERVGTNAGPEALDGVTARECSFHVLASELSREAKVVMHLLLNHAGGNKLPIEPKERKRMLRFVRQELSERGWEPEQIESAIDELRTAVLEM